MVDLDINATKADSPRKHASIDSFANEEQLENYIRNKYSNYLSEKEIKGEELKYKDCLRTVSVESECYTYHPEAESFKTIELGQKRESRARKEPPKRTSFNSNGTYTRV